MKTLPAFAVATCAVCTFVVGPVAHAQAPSDPYAYILAGAPVAQREGAGVLKWKPDYRFEASGDRAKRNALVNEAEKNGTRVKPAFGSIWHHLYGNDKAHVLHHMTIATPGATGAAFGLPENGTANGAWVMDAGTSSSHIMLPPQE